MGRLHGGATPWADWEDPPLLTTFDDIEARELAAASRTIFEQHAPDEREYVTAWEARRDPSGWDYPSVGTRAEGDG